MYVYKYLCAEGSVPTYWKRIIISVIFSCNSCQACSTALVFLPEIKLPYHAESKVNFFLPALQDRCVSWAAGDKAVALRNGLGSTWQSSLTCTLLSEDKASIKVERKRKILIVILIPHMSTLP